MRDDGSFPFSLRYGATIARMEAPLYKIGEKQYTIHKKLFAEDVTTDVTAECRTCLIEMNVRR